MKTLVHSSVKFSLPKKHIGPGKVGLVIALLMVFLGLVIALLMVFLKKALMCIKK